MHNNLSNFLNVQKRHGYLHFPLCLNFYFEFMLLYLISSSIDSLVHISGHLRGSPKHFQVMKSS